MMNIKIYWPSVEPKYRWAAQDRDGRVFLFTDKPTSNESGDQWVASKGVATIFNDNLPRNPYWKGALERNPIAISITMNLPHKHAASMLKYAEDAAETDAPWRLWEQRELMSDEWFVLENHPRWLVATQYRRIREGGVTITVPRSIVDDLLAWVDPVGVSHDDNGPLATVIRAFKKQLRITAEQV